MAARTLIRRGGALSATAVLAAAGVLAALVATGSTGSPRQAAAAAAGQAAPSVRLNQIQVIGSHNSYRFEPNAKEFGLISTVAGSQANGLQYSHAPLDQQFAGQHVRQIELDVWADPDGGRFARPLIRTLTGQPAEYDPRMLKKGTKVLHIGDLDYHSSCVAFVDCLSTVRTWSRAHPSHAPIAILVEFKDTLDISLPDSSPVPLMRWTRDRMLGLEQEIRSVFSEQDLLTPDDVRRNGLTLEQSVLRHGWPTLAAARGKVMFLMDNNGTYRDRYLQNNPSLQGRVLFTNATPGQPDAAFVKRNDPITAGADIRSLVTKGYLVRTRADWDTGQARTGDTSVRDAALASGAQWVSTDYPMPGLAARFGTGYYAALPRFVAARCNPVTATAGCAVTTP